MINCLIAILGVALICYVLFGGADYGAGILGLMPWGPHKVAIRSLIGKAIGPVWEANHIWLILIVVILFVGFPSIYSSLGTYLHWPLVMVLVGIVFRGCAFVFLHYDAIKDHTQIWYERIFSFSSLWTSFSLGLVLGGLNSGEIATTGSAYELYFSGWLQPYNLFLGLFVCSIFAFQAVVYLIGEVEDHEIKEALKKKFYILMPTTVVLGGCVFIASLWTKGSMALNFIKEPLSLLTLTLATILVYPLWQSVSRYRILRSRVLSGLLTSCIIVGFMAANFPNMMVLSGAKISIYAAAANEETLFQLLVALICGLVLIVPSLVFLLKTFKGQVKH